MKNNYVSFKQNGFTRFCFVQIFGLVLSISPIYSQVHSSLSGKLEDRLSREAVPYANIALFRIPDSILVKGQISDTAGYFHFNHIPAGKYRMIISIAGYEQFSERVDLTSVISHDARVILLNANIIGLKETVITADRLKGKSEKEKTIFFVTKKMTDASSNGLDIVKFIPGVLVDFKRNISLEGSQSIVIMVDGMERDNNYVSQIRPDQIDRVEIMSAPPAKYDGNITGVINIVMKKEKILGVSGQINMEIPFVSKYYIHPDYNLSLVLKKLTFYSSYNGELISFDQHESLRQKLIGEYGSFERSSDQYIKQKLWSHRFHYGIDFPLSPKSQVNFYGFFNPYNQKYTGLMEVGSDKSKELFRASRASEYASRSTYYSLFFKHLFNNRGNDLSIDVSNYHYSGENSVNYTALVSDPEFPSIVNHSLPELNAFSAKIDLNAGLSQKLKMSVGSRMKMQTMQELYYDDFQYTDKTYAVYVSVGYNLSRLDINSGLRVEKSISELKYAFHNPEVSLLPFALVNLKISADRDFKMGINRTICRPNLYQLNPTVSWDDPNNIHYGNPYLKPEMRTAIFVEYSKKYNSNYFSYRLFYNRNANVIGSLSFVNDTSVLETTFGNPGTMHQSGFQVSGTFRIGRIISFIPYLKLYSNYSAGNNVAKQYGIKDRHQIVMEPGFSSILSFKHEINLSIAFQYSNPRNSIQGNSYSDAFYMITMEKLFVKRLKAGIVSALPFAGNFTYQGSEIWGPDFQSKYSGDVLLSYPLFWFKLGYQFSTGKKNERTRRTIDESEILPGKRF